MNLNKKPTKTRIITTAIAILTVGFFAPEIADAAGTFSAIDQKGEDAKLFLTGTLALIAVTIAIIVAALGTLYANFQKETAVKILVAGVVIGAAGELATWIVA